MSYQPPGNDRSSQPSPQPSAYGHPAPPSPDYAAQPLGGYTAQPSSGYPAQGSSGYPANPPQYPGQPYGSGYPQPYGYAYPGQPIAAASTNGVAIASLVVSCAAVLGLCAYGLGGYLGIVGAILGHMGRRQIRERGESGEGLALAGVIIGWLTTAIAVIATVVIIVLVVWAARQESGSAPAPFETF